MTTALESVALAVLEMGQAGRFEEIRERFAPQLRPLVPAGAMRAAWAAEISRVGPVTGAGTPVSESGGPRQAGTAIAAATRPWPARQRPCRQVSGEPATSGPGTSSRAVNVPPSASMTTSASSKPSHR
jgi:hypothetical protein